MDNNTAIGITFEYEWYDESIDEVRYEARIARRVRGVWTSEAIVSFRESDGQYLEYPCWSVSTGAGLMALFVRYSDEGQFIDIYTSRDGGVTWYFTPQENIAPYSGYMPTWAWWLISDPINDKYYFLGDGGPDYSDPLVLWRSDDVGVTWTPTSAVFAKPDEQISWMYTGCVDGNGYVHVFTDDDLMDSRPILANKLYHHRSTDRGDTWDARQTLVDLSASSDNLVACYHYCWADGPHVFIAIVLTPLTSPPYYSNSLHILCSHDYGATWTPLSSSTLVDQTTSNDYLIGTVSIVTYGNVLLTMYNIREYDGGPAMTYYRKSTGGWYSGPIVWDGPRVSVPALADNNFVTQFIPLSDSEIFGCSRDGWRAQDDILGIRMDDSSFVEELAFDVGQYTDGQALRAQGACATKIRLPRSFWW